MTNRVALFVLVCLCTVLIVEGQGTVLQCKNVSPQQCASQGQPTCTCPASCCKCGEGKFMCSD